MQDFTKLAVWTKSHALALEVHRTTARGTERAYPGVVAALRRAAASIPAHIVEGCAQASPPAFAHRLQMAGASARDLAYQLLLARDLGLLSAVQYARLEARALQVQQMLGGLLRRVRGDLAPTPAAVPQRSRTGPGEGPGVRPGG